MLGSEARSAQFARRRTGEIWRTIRHETRAHGVRIESMRARSWVRVLGLGSFIQAVVACGEPAFDGFESTRPEPAVGGAGAVPIGSRARGGATNVGSSRGSSGGRTALGGTANGGAAIPAGGSATAEVPPESSGGSAAKSNSGGGRNGQGGRHAASGGTPALPAGGTTSAESAYAGESATAGGLADDSNGGADVEPSPNGGGGGASAPDETGGTSEGGASSSGGSPPVEPEPPLRTLWFSEYVEGKANNKALEIVALGPEALAGCSVEVYANGTTKASASWELEGEVSVEHPFVLCTEDLAELIGALCTRSAKLTFNGDDAVVLRCGEQLLDVLGQVGTRPDEQWGEGDLRTLDMTLRRACTVSRGDVIPSDVFDPGLEWIPAGTDEFSDLGSHCVTTNEP